MGTDAFVLRPGVVVDRARHVAYVMSPGGGIDAVGLDQGRQLWSSTAAAKPLALAGDLLVGQAEPTGTNGNLAVVTLDTRREGARVAAATMDMPAGVEASIADTLNKAFRAGARVVESQALVSWRETRREIRGAPPLEEDLPSDGRTLEAPAPGHPRVTTGAFTMDLTTGQTAPAAIDATPRELAPAVPDVVAVEARLADVPEPQYLSADGGHVLSSERIADDRTWDKYRWTIHARDTGAPLGAFRTFVSVAPFAVVDELVLYETRPFVRRSAQTTVQEPLQIRAVDLGTGREVWSYEIRDTEYRGPYPN